MFTSHVNMNLIQMRKLLLSGTYRGDSLVLTQVRWKDLCRSRLLRGVPGDFVAPEPTLQPGSTRLLGWSSRPQNLAEIWTALPP
jgi:hypothetical protein